MSGKRDGIRCTSLDASPAKYGDCELCDGHAGDEFNRPSDGGKSHGFGHESCVRESIGLKEAA